MKFMHIVGTAVAAIAMSACGNHNNTSPAAPAAPVTGTPAPPVAGTPAPPMTGTPAPPTTGTPAPPPMTTGQSLNTAAVLAQARVASETALPYAVNNGLLTITDTSDATGPINVN